MMTDKSDNRLQVQYLDGSVVDVTKAPAAYQVFQYTFRSYMYRLHRYARLASKPTFVKVSLSDIAQLCCVYTFEDYERVEEEELVELLGYPPGTMLYLVGRGSVETPLHLCVRKASQAAVDIVAAPITIKVPGGGTDTKPGGKVEASLVMDHKRSVVHQQQVIAQGGPPAEKLLAQQANEKEGKHKRKAEGVDLSLKKAHFEVHREGKVDSAQPHST